LINAADTIGLVGMLRPVDDLAESAFGGVGFDDDPADFLRGLHAERRVSGRGGQS